MTSAVQRRIQQLERQRAELVKAAQVAVVIEVGRRKAQLKELGLFDLEAVRLALPKTADGGRRLVVAHRNWVEAWVSGLIAAVGTSEQQKLLLETDGSYKLK